jgi:hypothetical protein
MDDQKHCVANKMLDGCLGVKSEHKFGHDLI